METINDRMEHIINERFDGNKAAFAKKIGLPPTGLSSYLGKQRRSKPSVDMVAKIVIELGVDACWLLTGKEAAKVEQVLTHGDFSPASLHGDAVNGNMDIIVLQEKVKHLEEMLAEKERLIKVYEKMMGSK